MYLISGGRTGSGVGAARRFGRGEVCGGRSISFQSRKAPHHGPRHKAAFGDSRTFETQYVNPRLPLQHSLSRCRWYHSPRTAGVAQGKLCISVTGTDQHAREGRQHATPLGQEETKNGSLCLLNPLRLLVCQVPKLARLEMTCRYHSCNATHYFVRSGSD